MTRFTRPLVLLTFAAALLVAPDSRAAGAPPVTQDSQIGVVMAAACGVAVRLALTTPNPVATAAAVYSCGFAFLDAIVTPDDAP